MRTIICDIDKKYFKLKEDDICFNSISNNCIGCFNCWLKTPLECIYNDELKNLGKTLLLSNELIIISSGKYGCYSEIVKGILERSISYVQPFFVIRNGEIHHKSRNENKLKFKVIFYDYEDKKNLIDLVTRNSINFNTQKPIIHFIKNLNDIGDLL